MSAERLERDLPGILADLGAAPAPDYADVLLARTARTRQRPGWVFLERWLPMDLVAQPLGARFPSFRRFAIVAAAILLALAFVALAFIAGSARRLPPAFGPAGNGLVTWSDGANVIVADPVTGNPRTIARGELDRPRFSPDGTRIAYLQSEGGRISVVVAGPDGTGPVSVTPEPIAAVKFFEWSPDSRSVVLTDALNRVLRFDAARAAEPTVLVAGGDRDIGGDWNNQVASFYRPPDGRQIAFLGLDRGAEALMIASADGSDVRSIVGKATSGIAYVDLLWPSWSPDGTTIAFTAAAPESPDLFHAYLVNADGTNLRRLTPTAEDANDGMPIWSPDGRSIAMQRWYSRPDGVDVRPITIIDVATGTAREVGDVSRNGYLSFGWSPDGRSVLAVPNATNEMLVIDVATGEARDSGFVVKSAVSWQRLAP